MDQLQCTCGDCGDSREEAWSFNINLIKCDQTALFTPLQAIKLFFFVRFILCRPFTGECIHWNSW